MHEYLVNLHMHTPYSDGTGTHAEIAQAALKAGLDAVMVTDHNIWLKGPEGYYKEGSKRVLMLIGEEIHNQARNPQKNHLLVFGAERELATKAANPQNLIDAVRQAEGLCFLAHPHDRACPTVGEDAIEWVDWDVQGYTGIELWNGLSEIKARIGNRLQSFWYALNPARVARGPEAATLKKWDDLLREGRRVVAIGGSDAHALHMHAGPIKRTVFPYEFHFRAINTHIFTPEPFTGDYAHDRRLLLDALQRGHAFIGYDLPAPTRGFQFKAQGKNQSAWMGDEIATNGGVTLQIRLPFAAECRLLRDGDVVKQWDKQDTCTHITSEAGAYRVEAYLPYLGRRRGWIFSNPIYLRSK
ncbi:MAG: hypothetical protein OHK0052_07580 [Anaerolineales bacterium]